LSKYTSKKRRIGGIASSKRDSGWNKRRNIILSLAHRCYISQSL